MVRRRQAVISYRLKEEPYFISVRALTLNPEVTERQLIMIAIETARGVELQFQIKVSRQMGFEDKEISVTEERTLNKKDIFVQVQVRSEITVFRRIKHE